MRVLMCAGRHYADRQTCRQVLNAFQRLHKISVLVHGGHPLLGGEVEDWAREQGVDIVRYPPNWQLHGKQAERLRNTFMLNDSRPDTVIALPGGEDTQALLAQANAAGIKTLSINERS
ncbi:MULTISPECIES: DUF2493 domain-containing protein [unclassified Pseudomonas]|uniref:DUF2493 domain-containing protein n=1 Tax=unclassified Pseudomonas TaxID=196821 RepID=UPI000BA47CE7|nr:MULTISPECIES: DUF2493 domain-containing protein [unclassified Pseudomonas]